MSQNENTVDWSDIDEKAEQERVKGELNHPNFRKWFSGLLREAVVTVTFFKVNGETRIMDCTLMESQIPDDKQPKGTSTRKVSEDTIAVFDIKKQDWRSFRFDSIKEFDYNLPEDSEYPWAPDQVMFDDEGNEIERPSIEELEDDIQDVEAKTIH